MILELYIFMAPVYIYMSWFQVKRQRTSKKKKRISKHFTFIFQGYHSKQ